MRRELGVGGGGGVLSVTTRYEAEAQWTEWHFRLAKSIPSLYTSTTEEPVLSVSSRS